MSLQGDPLRAVIIKDSNNDEINEDNPLIVREQAFTSSNNTTKIPLPADTGGDDHIFTGDSEEVLQFGTVLLAIYSDVISANNGFCIENSSDGITWFNGDEYSYISPGVDKTYSFQATRKYWRVVYANGISAQSIFNLEVQLKPGYVKPSSHRLGDTLSPEDDAELIKSNIIAKSTIDGSFENITSYRESLDVNNGWKHRKIVNETFHRHTGVTTNPSTEINEGDISIDVDSVVGFLEGDEIKLEEIVDGIGVQEIGLMTITDITALTITLDRPLGFEYTTSATLYNVTSDMAVTGTLASPIIFEIDPPEGITWQFTRLLIAITDATAPDDGKFGGNVDYSDKAPAGNHGVNGRWTFTQAEVVAEITGTTVPVQKMEILIQDDLTDLLSFKIRAQGRVEN